MIVVADSGPLHYLILLGHVGLLQRFYSRVAVPDAVAAELLSPGAPDAVRAWVGHPPPWVQVLPVASEALAAVTIDLDQGERSAIALAEILHADLLLIDEAAGRAEARRRHLRVTGTLGVLRAGAELGLVDVADLIVRLHATSFYVDESLLNTTRTTGLEKYLGYFKAGLHELGHALGLAHPTATLAKPEGTPKEGPHRRGGTVMNPHGRKDDSLGLVALVPTACDIKAVKAALAR